MRARAFLIALVACGGACADPPHPSRSILAINEGNDSCIISARCDPKLRTEQGVRDCFDTGSAAKAVWCEIAIK